MGPGLDQKPGFYSRFLFSRKAFVYLILFSAKLIQYLLTSLFYFIREFAMTSCFLALGTASCFVRAMWVPTSIVYWLIVVFRSFSNSVRRSARCQHASHRKCRSPYRSQYLVRLDYRLLVFTAYQIAPSWAYVFHATDPWLCRFVRSVGSFNQLFFWCSHFDRAYAVLFLSTCFVRVSSILVDCCVSISSGYVGWI